MVSPRSMLLPLPGCAPAAAGRGGTAHSGSGTALLLPHSWQAAPTRHVGNALLELLLRLHQAGARQDVDRVAQAQAVQDLAVVEVREPRPHPGRHRLAAALHEDDPTPARERAERPTASHSCARVVGRSPRLTGGVAPRAPAPPPARRSVA